MHKVKLATLLINLTYSASLFAAGGINSGFSGSGGINRGPATSNDVASAGAAMVAGTNIYTGPNSFNKTLQASNIVATNIYVAGSSGYYPFTIGQYDGANGSFHKTSSGVMSFVDDSQHNGYAWNFHNALAQTAFGSTCNLPEPPDGFFSTYDVHYGKVWARYFDGNISYSSGQQMPFNALDARAPVPWVEYTSALDPNGSVNGAIQPSITNIQFAVNFYNTNLPANMKSNFVIWIDEGWAHTNRNGDGSIMVNSNLFPAGMDACVDMIHASNFLVGIYTTVGTAACGYPVDSGPVTSAKQIQTDVNYFMELGTGAKKGVDAIKIDSCIGGFSSPLSEAYVFDTVTYYTEVYRGYYGGTKQPILLYTVFITTGGNLNLITYDVASQMNSWEDPVGGLSTFSQMFQYAYNHTQNSQYSRIGHYNEGISPTEDCSTNAFAACIAVNAMMPSPQFVGLLTNTAQLYWLTNSGAYSILEDPACLPYYLVYSNALTEVWARPLQSKINCQSNAVLLVNLDNSTHAVGFAFTNLNLGQPNETFNINDVWTGASVASNQSTTYTNATLAATSFQWVTVSHILTIPPTALSVGTTFNNVDIPTNVLGTHGYFGYFTNGVFVSTGTY